MTSQHGAASDVVDRRRRRDRSAMTEGVVHVGLGAFARAHVLRYCDDLLETDPGVAVHGITLRSARTRDALAPQDWLYTLVETDGVAARGRVIEALGRISTGGRAAVAAIADPRTRVITVTVTEKGYHLRSDGHLDVDDPAVALDLAHPDEPTTTPGVLVAGLGRRLRRGLGPVPIVSCDNLSANGRATRTAVGELAGVVDPQVADWIDGAVPFPSTVVDRIVPAVGESQRAAMVRRLGYEDAAPVLAESHCAWVIERCEGLPGWDRVGATITDDVTPWETRKLHTVNGPHSALAYLGGLAGHDTIAAAVADDAMSSFVEAMIVHEATVGIDATAARRMASDTLARFANPALEHRCEQVAADGARKLAQRIVDPMLARRSTGDRVDRLALVVAAWVAWVIAAVHGRHELVEPDPAAIVGALTAAGDDPEHRVAALLAVAFPPEVAGDAVLSRAVSDALRLLEAVGPVEAARRTT